MKRQTLPSQSEGAVQFGSDVLEYSAADLKTHLWLDSGRGNLRDGETSEEMSDQKPAGQGVHG